MNPHVYPEPILDRPSSRHQYLRWQAESYVSLWCQMNGLLPRESDVRKTIDALENGLLSWGPKRLDCYSIRNHSSFDLRVHQTKSDWRPANLCYHARLVASLAFQQLQTFWRHGCFDIQGSALRAWLRPNSKPEIHWRGPLPACCFTTLIEERPARIDDTLLFCRYCRADLHYHQGVWEKLPLPAAGPAGPELSRDDRALLEKEKLAIEMKIASLLKPKPMSDETLERVLSLKKRKIIIGKHRYNSLGHYLDEIPLSPNRHKAPEPQISGAPQ